MKNQQVAQSILPEIKKLTKQITKKTMKARINLMEVCGTHTMAIAASGIRSLLPKEINMLSGPGCPVCVTSTGEIDMAIDLADQHNAIIATFGDMMKVRGSTGSLQDAKADGHDIRIIYSPFELVGLARANPNKNVIFIGVGFETTIPAIASAIKQARANGIKNLFVLPIFKLVPPALKAILSGTDHNIHGFILPGHVSAIIGAKPYEFVVKDHEVPCVITGFEPMDILQGILMVLKQLIRQKPRLEIEYSRCVKPNGNPVAINTMNEVFQEADARWRAISTIPRSGLSFRKPFIGFDALKRFNIRYKETPEPKGCLCGAILTGKAKPKQCKHFGKSCTPTKAIGPCMVSSEGACAAEYRYGPPFSPLPLRSQMLRSLGEGVEMVRVRGIKKASLSK
ncbi:hydrogenase formation protein HypD [Elusimicrobiota bacterium]